MREILNARKRHVRSISGLIFIIFIIAVVIAMRPLRQMVRGIKYQNMPLALTRDDLLDSIKRDGASRIEIDDLADTGFYYESESGYSDVHFTYTLFDDMYLIIGQYGSQQDVKVFDDTRKSIVLSYHEQNYHNQLTADIAKAIAEATDANVNDVRAYIFDEVMTLEGYRSNLLPALFLILGPLLWMIAYYVIFSYKAIRDLEKYLSPEEMARLDENIANAKFKFKKVVITDTYFVHLTGGKLSKTILYIDDITWVYSFVLTQRYYGIKIRNHYILKVFLEGKKKPIDVKCARREDMDDLIDALLEQKSDLVVGYQKRYLDEWKMSRSGARLQVLAQTPETSK